MMEMEKKLRNHDFPEAIKDKITGIVADVLNKDEGVIFAYLGGSFITEGPFRDIDIFVFLSDMEDPFASSIRIKESLFDTFMEAGINTFAIDNLDVRVINDSPYDFLIDLFSGGRLIVDKNPDLRTDIIESVSDEYRVNYFILDEVYR